MSSLPHTRWISTRGKPSCSILVRLLASYAASDEEDELVGTNAPAVQVYVLGWELFANMNCLVLPFGALRPPLAALQKQCSQRVRGVRKETLNGDLNSFMRHPPAYLFRH